MKLATKRFWSRTVLRRILPAVLIVAVFCGFLVGGYALGFSYGLNKKIDEIADISVVHETDNVIFMIGDGMGFNHIKAAKKYNDDKMTAMETFPLKGEATTYSRAVFSPTDSAASGTALSTTKKVNNGNVARYDGEDLETLCEYAKKRDKATGVVVTETLTGATPASFSSHANDRDDTEEIFNGQMSSGIDLFICAGKSYFDEKQQTIEENGYSYVTKYSELADAEGKVFAAFDEISTGGHTDDKPTLAKLCEFAYTYLESASDEEEDAYDGFFLMVEGSHIDKRSHSNDINGMMAQLLAFDAAVAEIAGNALVSGGKSAVIVTADHETGGLKSCDGLTKADLTDALFTRGGHSSANVPYFVLAAGLSGLPSVMDNTQLSLLARHLLGNAA